MADTVMFPPESVVDWVPNLWIELPESGRPQSEKPGLLQISYEYEQFLHFLGWLLQEWKDQQVLLRRACGTWMAICWEVTDDSSVVESLSSLELREAKMIVVFGETDPRVVPIRVLSPTASLAASCYIQIQNHHCVQVISQCSRLDLVCFTCNISKFHDTLLLTDYPVVIKHGFLEHLTFIDIVPWRPYQNPV